MVRPLQQNYHCPTMNDNYGTRSNICTYFIPLSIPLICQACTMVVKFFLLFAMYQDGS